MDNMSGGEMARSQAEDHYDELLNQQEYEAAWNFLLFAAKQALLSIEEGYDAPKIRDDLRAAIKAVEAE